MAYITTTWTEQDIVAFTSGVLSSLADCVAEVEAKINRGTLTTATTPTLAQVEGWLKRGKMELAEAKGFTFDRKYAAVTLVADQYIYGLPPDYNGGSVSLRDTTNDRYITIWPANGMTRNSQTRQKKRPAKSLLHV